MRRRRSKISVDQTEEEYIWSVPSLWRCDGYISSWPGGRLGGSSDSSVKLAGRHKRFLEVNSPTSPIYVYGEAVLSGMNTSS